MSDREVGDVDLSLLATTAKGLLDQLIGLDGDATSQAELVTKLDEIVIALERLRPALPLKH